MLCTGGTFQFYTEQLLFRNLMLPPLKPYIKVKYWVDMVVKLGHLIITHSVKRSAISIKLQIQQNVKLYTF